MKKGDGYDLAPGSLESVPQQLQLKPSESFAPGYIALNTPFRLTAGEGQPDYLFANPPEWTEQAACLPEPEATRKQQQARFDLFEKPEQHEFKRVVKPICDGCPVSAECLEAAMEDEGSLPAQFRTTVRGGLRSWERYRLYRARVRGRRQVAA